MSINTRKWNVADFIFSVAILQGVLTVVALIVRGSFFWKADVYETGVYVNRLKLLYSEPAYLSFICGILLIISIHRIIVSDISWKIILSVLIFVFDMLLSYGMGGMISLVVAATAMLMAHIANNRDAIRKNPFEKYKWMLTLAILIAVILAIVMISPTYGFRVATLARGTDTGLSFTVRKPFGIFTEIMHQTNWRGIGLGNQTRPEIADVVGNPKRIKNSFLLFLTQGGAIAAVVLTGLALWLLAYVLLYGSVLSLALFIYIMLYQCTAGRFDDPINWMVYGLILADCMNSRESAKKQEMLEESPDEVVVGIIGAKGLGNYGGYETFVDKLTEYHANHSNIKYLIACKANGTGFMDEKTLKGAVSVSDNEFTYHNAHCFKINVPQIGAGQAIIYDIMSAIYCLKYFRKHNIKKPILYVLTCRIGPFIGLIASVVHDLGGVYYVNPDGHEWRRSVWKPAVRKYWKFSENLMIKYADLVICDSKNIETYINATYDMYNPNTTYIAYGAEIEESGLEDTGEKFRSFLDEHGLKEIGWLIVGRFVPENNFETMIREFMKSNSKKNLVIVTNVNKLFWDELEEKLHFTRDKRIKFVGTVYDPVLLKKLRENAYGYFHGHSVGGTNPSLLEALSSTKLNLLLDVGFNRECGEDGALYWTKEEGNLASLIEYAEQLSPEKIERYSNRAKERIKEAYSWQYIADKYERVFENIRKK